MDYKLVKQAKYAFRFNKSTLELYRIDPLTGKETFMGKDFVRGAWNAYTWGLDASNKSWVSIKIKESKIMFWVKEVAEGAKRAQAKHYQVIVEPHEEQRVAIGDPDEMIRQADKSWIKKELSAV